MRSQRILIKDAKSASFDLTFGVPQGSTVVLDLYK